MNKENIIPPQYGEPAARITRARAKALSTLGGILVQKCSVKPDQKCVARTNLKRPAPNEDKPNDIANAGSKNKRIAVLKEVTNVLCESSYMNCLNAAKVQPKKRPSRCLPKKRPKVEQSFSSENAQAQEDIAFNSDQTSRTSTEEQELPVRLNENISIQALFSPKPLRMQKKEENVLCDKMGNPGSGITNIDSRQKDPQMCSLYAPDIYNNLHVTELERRPSAYFMETVQRDITQSMRGILIDWLVEVSEEYTLVPDTLYLTVNFIDRFLSDNYIEKQRLQLLGVTCMLIASKYEEICAPHVEEFCFITDNTYSKEEVVKMESHVLNFLRFQLSIPTTKTFLRRFIQAAQARYEIPCAELEFLANYLAEITLVDYNFLKFLPSLVAASAVFLACWTLDQSDHPWSPTLEYYTNYKAAELKTSVLALQDLHIKTREGSLNSIREKYKQQKFMCVANLTPPKHVESLFKD